MDAAQAASRPDEQYTPIMISRYKAFFCALLGAACILFFFYRHYLGRAVANYIQENVTAMDPKLGLHILWPSLRFPLGLHADTIQLTWKNQSNLNPIQVKLYQVKSVLNIKPLLHKRVEISFSADIWQGRLTGFATIRDLKLDQVSMVSRFTGVDPEEILSILNISELLCTGPINGTIQTKITNGRVEKWTVDIITEQIDLRQAKAIPVIEDTSFSTAMISCERTGQAPIQITSCKIIGEQADIQLSGEIKPAASFIKSQLNLAIKIIAHPQRMEHSQRPMPANELSDIHSIHFTLTGSPESPNLKPLTGFLNLLSNKHQSVAKADRPVQRKNVPPDSLKKNTLKINNTSLGLKLIGTVIGSGIEPLAIIRKKAGKLERLYALGETVDNAKIVTIMRRQVVLLVNGKEQLLSMENSEIMNDQSMISSSGPSNYFRKIVLTQKDLNRIINNLDNLNGQIQITPHSHKDKDQTDGYRISGLKKDSILYKKLGLRQGDIVTEINNQPIDSLYNLSKLYNQFVQENLDSDIEIKIERNGTSELLKYRIK